MLQFNKDFNCKLELTTANLVKEAIQKQLYNEFKTTAGSTNSRYRLRAALRLYDLFHTCENVLQNPIFQPLKIQYIRKLTELKFQQFSDQISLIILDYYLEMTNTKKRPKISGNTELVNFSSGCTVFEISDMIFQIGGWTCFIPRSPNSGHCFRFALVMFGFQVDLDSAIIKTGILRKCCIWWKTPGCWQCFRCQEVSHLAVDCKVFLPPSSKTLKMFKTYFVSSVSYAKTSASLDSSEFPSLAAFISPFVVIGDFLVSSQLASLESDLVKLSALVEFIVKPVSSLVKLFEQFINGNLILSSKLGLKINKVMMYMSSFNKIVGKLEREMVFLKKKCCIEDINMSGNSEHQVGLDNEVFSNLMSLWEHKPIDVKANALKTAKWLISSLDKFFSSVSI
ncbi:hypothetical protein G9A89_019854 [Geosiphon pyriformis]|nr:hypothetical protein G9A89_019854 [Geosiphon pyriformis]